MRKAFNVFLSFVAIVVSTMPAMAQEQKHEQRHKKSLKYINFSLGDEWLTVENVSLQFHKGVAIEDAREIVYFITDDQLWRPDRDTFVRIITIMRYAMDGSSVRAFVQVVKYQGYVRTLYTIGADAVMVGRDKTTIRVRSFNFVERGMVETLTELVWDPSIHDLHDDVSNY